MDKPVVGYLRVSRTRDEMKAPELYRADIHRYCTLRGLVLADVFEDIDYSARRGSPTRPALDELVSRRHEFSAVVVPKLSRFGRSVSHLARLFDLFDDSGVALVFLDLNLDTGTSQGRLLRNVMAAFAEYESDVRSDYARSARDYRARRGLPNGGWVAFGYKRHGDNYIIDAHGAQLVREIFDRYSGGASMISIARALNERGTPSPTGRRWTKPTVRNILENPHYAALRRLQDELVEGTWEPIVSRDLWQLVQTRRQAVALRGGPAPSTGLYLLSGLITCGHCGSKLCHRTRQDRVPGTYVCRGPDNLGSCLGGGIAEHRAHGMVTEAYLTKYGSQMAMNPITRAAPVPLRLLWEAAELQQRREMLLATISSISLPPRPTNNRRGLGLPRGRTLAIEWTEVECSSRGMSWNEWRKQSLLTR